MIETEVAKRVVGLSVPGPDVLKHQERMDAEWLLQSHGPVQLQFDIEKNRYQTIRRGIYCRSYGSI